MKVRPWSGIPDLRLTAQVVAGRYRLDDLLGRGGAADVYEALDLRLRRPVALKVFRPEGEAQAVERFADEGRLLARLHHPGLVTVYDYGQEDGRPYLVIELVRGTTLSRRIAAAPMTPAEASRFGAALASALAHVHAAGVVHRDVKPSNILLGETGAPYLSDFGISRQLDTATRTDTGALVGTAAYMAPEQVLGRGAGPAADVYSFGLVLLEAVKGELEYGGAPLEAAVARLHRPPVIPESLPGALAELLEAMTDPDEHSRPDAHACWRALSAVSAVSAVPTVPEGRPGPPALTGAGPLGEDRSPAGDTLRPATTRARARGAVPEATATPGEGDRAPKPSSPAGPSVRAGRALLTAGAVLALFGTTLTGADGGRSAEAEDEPSHPPSRTATAPPSSPADRPDPSSASAVPASGRDPRTGSPAGQATGQTAPAGGRGEPGGPEGRAAGGPPEHGKAQPRPVKAKSPKAKHTR
ncbi:serine/threonine-protein kinase [Streptomyces sp. t39]|uniref:serine/threonine-protein kinase n=1 Tax=Streptomyces sp. t39 TaxID=1828156 RepID=UPI0021C6F9BE|nr:serine/threonine-protein kinase [Streptomyces sp. t39]